MAICTLKPSIKVQIYRKSGALLMCVFCYTPQIPWLISFCTLSWQMLLRLVEAQADSNLFFVFYSKFWNLGMGWLKLQFSTWHRTAHNISKRVTISRQTWRTIMSEQRFTTIVRSSKLERSTKFMPPGVLNHMIHSIVAEVVWHYRQVRNH